MATGSRTAIYIVFLRRHETCRWDNNEDERVQPSPDRTPVERVHSAGGSSRVDAGRAHEMNSCNVAEVLETIWEPGPIS